MNSVNMCGLRGVSVAMMILVVGGMGCGSSSSEGRAGGESVRSRAMAGNAHAQDNNQRCNGEGANREVSEYDTSGDNRPDVRKVFLRVGTPPAARLILVCRESDLNADGRKDAVRYYNDEGRPLREEADRNFDGTMDITTFFENGVVIREELDENKDGTLDTKVFFMKGKPDRAERDLGGRSSQGQWKPDRWEYYENGRMVRMGTDLDGDGKVDRWDRNDELRKNEDEEDTGGDDDSAEGDNEEG